MFALILAHHFERGRVGVDRVFTSGRAESAWGGRDVIANLVKAAEGRIVVMPGLSCLWMNETASERHVFRICLQQYTSGLERACGCHYCIVLIAHVYIVLGEMLMLRRQN